MDSTVVPHFFHTSNSTLENPRTLSVVELKPPHNPYIKEETRTAIIMKLEKQLAKTQSLRPDSYHKTFIFGVAFLGYQLLQTHANCIFEVW